MTEKYFQLIKFNFEFKTNGTLNIMSTIL